MASAELVSPTFIKKWQEEGVLDNGIIHCDNCSLANYSIQDYEILYKHKKLAYFFFVAHNGTEAKDDPLLCHSCFLNELKKLAKDKQEGIRITLLDDDNAYECDFVSEELIDGDPEPDLDDDDDEEDEGFWPFFPPKE